MSEIVVGIGQSMMDFTFTGSSSRHCIVTTKARKTTRVSCKGTPFQVDIEAFSAKDFEDMSQVVNISSFDAINQNIVEVDNDEFDNNRLQQLSHYSHEYTEGID